jgi:carbon storage regulator
VIQLLVLTRKRNQSIIIGDDIEVTIVEIRGDQVRLGVEAPRSVSVHRREVYEEIRQANREAVSATRASLPGVLNLIRKP